MSVYCRESHNLPWQLRRLILLRFGVLGEGFLNEGFLIEGIARALVPDHSSLVPAGGEKF